MSINVPAPTRAQARAQLSGILRPSRHPVAVLVTAAVAIVAITVVGFLLRSHTIDLALSETLNKAHTGFVGGVANVVYTVFGPLPAIILTALATAIIWAVSRQLKVGLAFAGVVAATWIPSDLVKLLVHRPRPDVHLMSHPFSPVQVDPSFPSGHTVFITAFVIALVYVLRDTRWVWVAAIAGGVLVVGVGLCLAIDAVHYPTDVVASILWSLAVAPAARLIWVDWLMPLIPGLRPSRR